jgi:2-oxoglutarate dehydrogenase complex dehydrogenase (E1) component-like enzyme
MNVAALGLLFGSRQLYLCRPFSFFQMIGHSYLSNADPNAIEELYQKYKKEPLSLDISWQRFFEGFDLAYSLSGNMSHVVSEDMLKEINVLRMINEGYRTRGQPIRFASEEIFLPTFQ